MNILSSSGCHIACELLSASHGAPRTSGIHLGLRRGIPARIPAAHLPGLPWQGGNRVEQRGSASSQPCELEEGASQAVVTVDSLGIDSETARNPLIRSLHPPRTALKLVRLGSPAPGPHLPRQVLAPKRPNHPQLAPKRLKKFRYR